MTTDQVGESRDVGALLRGERQVLETIATGAPLAAVLDALCSVIDQRSGLTSAVFLVDGDGTRTPAMTSCGAAVSRRKPIVVSDVSSDPLFEKVRELARAAAIGAVWSAPLYTRDDRS
jgi:two-component system cell cycle sensor histidine kinase/response regulator CckA